MPESTTFSCDSCGKTYSWKPELAGKKAKCKCGSVIAIPSGPPAESADDLYDFAPSEEPAKPKKAPRAPLAPLAPRSSGGGSSTVAPLRQPQGTTIASAGGGAGVVGYGQPLGAAKKDRFTNDTLMDMKRDVHVPVALLVVGFLIYISYYAYKYHFSGAGLAFSGIGLGLLTAFKAILLVGFAMMVAGPVGVSFGGIWTATLKLAALSVFCDGVIVWLQEGIIKLAGLGGGLYSMTFIFFVSAGVYWLLMIYLFSMDPGDCWLVVCLLAVFNLVVRTVLLLLLLATILNWGGVSAAVPTFGGGTVTSGSSSSDPWAEERIAVQEMKDAGQLEEATKYLEKTGRHAYMTDCVKEWYAAGCKNLWFPVSRDINGRMDTSELIVELPKDKDARAKCFEILGKYYKAMGSEADPDDLKDDGAPYLNVPVR